MEGLKIITGLLMPLVVALVGNWYTSSLKQQEIQKQYIEIATSILREESSPETEHIRSWALDIISQYSPVPLDEATRNELIDRRETYRVFNQESQKLPSDLKLEVQLFYTQTWLDDTSRTAPDLKKALSDAGYFDGDLEDPSLDGSVIDAVTAFQTENFEAPDVDGICGEICYSKLAELGGDADS